MATDDAFYTWGKVEPLSADNFTRRFLDLSNRLKPLEALDVSWKAVMATAVQAVLAQDEAVLAGLRAQLAAIVALDWLTAVSATPVTLTPNTSVSIQIAPSDAELFAPGPFSVLQSNADPATYAVVKTLGYDRTLGQYAFTILTAAGQPGPFADWSVQAVSGSTLAQMTALAQGLAALATAEGEATAAHADRLAADVDAAATAADRTATHADRLAADASATAAAQSGTAASTSASQVASALASIANGPIVSVNGKRAGTGGAVTLAPADVGALPATGGEITGSLTIDGNITTKGTSIDGAVEVLGAGAAVVLSDQNGGANPPYGSLYCKAGVTYLGNSSFGTALSLGAAGTLTFSLSPTGPTPAAGDSSSLLSTTAFVARALGTAVADTATNGQDIRTLALILSAQAGFPIGLTSGGVDAFDNQVDVNTAACLNQAYDATNRRYAPTPPGYTVVSAASQAISGGDRSGYPASQAFDSNTTSFWSSSQTGASANGTADIGQDFGSSPKAISQVSITNYTSAAGYAPTSVAVQYSDDGANWTTATTSTLVTNAGTVTTIAVPASGAHRYWCVRAESAIASSNYWYVAEATFSVTSSGAMTLQSVPFASSVASPTQARVVVQVDPASVAFTVNTDLVAAVSRDGGTTWTQGTLALGQSFGDGTALYDTGLIAIGGQPAGSSLVWRVTTPTGKSVVVTGVILQWKV